MRDYRDLAGDFAGKHAGKPCDACGEPIGDRSYSGIDLDTGKTTEKLCRKGCGKYPDPHIAMNARIAERESRKRK